VETGGVIIGRFSPLTHSFYIVDLVKAPEDSVFSAEKFVLGTHGLKAAIRRIIEISGGCLYALGTWHNHLGQFEASILDTNTAIALALQQYLPVLMLIALPEGYTFLTAESFDREFVAPARVPDARK
jgi:hypothetical protein